MQLFGWNDEIEIAAKKTYHARPASWENGVNGVRLHYCHNFHLTVTNDLGATASDSVTVRQSNLPPTANAGPDQLLLAGRYVTLDGRGSTDDGVIARYSWTQTAGTAVSFLEAGTAQPRFMSAITGADYTVSFELQVTDDNQLVSTVDSVTVRVLNPNQDSDADGIANVQEFVDGTNPLVADPKPAAVSRVVVLPGDTDNVIVWDHVSRGGSYDLYFRISSGVTTTNGTKIANVKSPYRQVVSQFESTHA